MQKTKQSSRRSWQSFRNHIKTCSEICSKDHWKECQKTLSVEVLWSHLNHHHRHDLQGLNILRGMMRILQLLDSCSLQSGWSKNLVEKEKNCLIWLQSFCGRLNRTHMNLRYTYFVKTLTLNYCWSFLECLTLNLWYGIHTNLW